MAAIQPLRPFKNFSSGLWATIFMRLETDTSPQYISQGDIPIEFRRLFRKFACLFAEIIIMSHIDTIEIYTEISLFKTALRPTVAKHFEGRCHFPDKSLKNDKKSRFGCGHSSG